uniref:Uncharacterized protein n=1 Tax=Romanomermis culicivorax TaxID=13658 RepID=A0A915L9J1_ROMCU
MKVKTGRLFLAHPPSQSAGITVEFFMHQTAKGLLPLFLSFSTAIKSSDCRRSFSTLRNLETS